MWISLVKKKKKERKRKKGDNTKQPFSDPELRPYPPPLQPALMCYGSVEQGRGTLNALKLNASLSRSGLIQQDAQWIVEDLSRLGFCKE